MDGERMDRLQWWYHVTPAQEQMYEGKGLAFYRVRAIERFCKHVERWLDITGQRFHGNEPIPRLGSQHCGSASASMPAAPVDRLAAIRMDLDAIDKVANG
jgi:hypothetical protein